MEINLEEILLIKHFLKNFEVYFEKTPYESIDELNNTGKTNLIKNNSQVGFILNNKSKSEIIINFDEFRLKADILKNIYYKKPIITIKYLLENNNLDKIYGKYNINNINYNFKKGNVVKHNLFVFKDNINVSKYNFFTKNNNVYLKDNLNNEYAFFDNDGLKYGIDDSYTIVNHIDGDNMVNYFKKYYHNLEERVCCGVYIFSDKDKILDYVKIMKEIDSEYEKFIEKKRNELNDFCYGLFDNIINDSFISLNEYEKEALFCTHNSKVKKINKNNK